MTVLDRLGGESRGESLDPEDWDEALAVALSFLQIA